MDKVVHFEIPADNVSRAKKFYESVFSWKIEKSPMPGMEYWGVHTVAVDEKTRMPKEMGAINGGMMPRQNPGQQVTIAMSVKDIKATLKKAEQAGGKVVMPVMPVGDMGWYAYLRDPEGNVIGVWQDAKKPAAAEKASRSAKAKKR